MASKLLKLNFTQSEWDFLQGEPLFRAAAAKVKTYQDVESVSVLGKRLIAASKRKKR